MKSGQLCRLAPTGFSEDRVFLHGTPARFPVTSLPIMAAAGGVKILNTACAASWCSCWLFKDGKIFGIKDYNFANL